MNKMYNEHDSSPMEVTINVRTLMYAFKSLSIKSIGERKTPYEAQLSCEIFGLAIAIAH